MKEAKKAIAWLEKLYNHLLVYRDNGKRAKDFLSKRNIDIETAKRFNLGYAPSTELVIEFLRGKNFDIGSLVKGKVLHRYRDGNIGNLFQDRLVFPIHNHEGEAVAFGGRALSDNDVKYINSPNSEIYQKDDNLYGFHLAKSDIEEKNFAILVEGYFDVITSHQHGLKNTVAPLGTALTVNQALLIKSVTKNVVIAFDGDEAGKEASYRSASILKDVGCNVKIADLSGLDPDDYIRKKGVKTYFENAISPAKEVTEDFIQYELGKADFSCDMNRFSVVKKTLENFSTNHTKGQEKLLKQLSDALGLSFELVQGVVERGWNN